MLNFEPQLAGGRLTLTTALPVTTANVTAATTIYYTPYKHGIISLYNGTNWLPYVFTEQSLSLSGFTASRPYDIFGYVSAGGVFAIEALVWTSTTARATAIVLQDGVWVKSGDATRRYLGTICITTVSGQCTDSAINRGVWNVANQVSKKLVKLTASGIYAYNTATWRPWENSTANKVECVVGVADFLLTLNVALYQTYTTGGSGYTGVGIDSTTANSAEIVQKGANATSATLFPSLFSRLQTYPAVGYHAYYMLEIAGTNTGGTFYGVTGQLQSGLSGEFIC